LTESAHVVFVDFFEVAVSVDEMPSFMDKGISCDFAGI